MNVVSILEMPAAMVVYVSDDGDDTVLKFIGPKADPVSYKKGSF